MTDDFDSPSPMKALLGYVIIGVVGVLAFVGASYAGLDYWYAVIVAVVVGAILSFIMQAMSSDKTNENI